MKKAKILILVLISLLVCGTLTLYIQYRIELADEKKILENSIETDSYETEIILFDESEETIEDNTKNNNSDTTIEDKSFINWLGDKIEDIVSKEDEETIETNPVNPVAPIDNEEDEDTTSDPNDQEETVDPTSPEDPSEPNEPSEPVEEDTTGLVDDGNGNYSLPYIEVPD